MKPEILRNLLLRYGGYIGLKPQETVFLWHLLDFDYDGKEISWPSMDTLMNRLPQYKSKQSIVNQMSKIEGIFIEVIRSKGKSNTYVFVKLTKLLHPFHELEVQSKKLDWSKKLDMSKILDYYQSKKIDPNSSKESLQENSSNKNICTSKKTDVLVCPECKGKDISDTKRIPGANAYEAFCFKCKQYFDIPEGGDNSKGALTPAPNSLSPESQSGAGIIKPDSYHKVERHYQSRELTKIALIKIKETHLQVKFSETVKKNSIDMFEKMLRIDKITVDEIMAVLKWLPTAQENGNGFSWKNQVLSPLKLRRKDKNGVMFFYKLQSAMKQESKKPDSAREKRLRAKLAI